MKNLHNPLSGNKISLKDVETGKLYEGQILESFPNEMPLGKDGWQFGRKSADDRKLSADSGAAFLESQSGNC